MPSLRISLVASQPDNEYDDRLRKVFTNLTGLINQQSPAPVFDGIDFLKFSYNDEPYMITRNTLATIPPGKYIKCMDVIVGKVTPLFAVKKNHQKIPYFSAFFIAAKDSEINSIKSDKIKRIYLVSPGSTSGYIAPLYKLWEAGVISQPSPAGIQEKNWEIIFAGNQRDIEKEIINDKEAIGCTGQFSYQEEPEKCLVKPVLRYDNLPQDVLIISNDLLPYRDVISNWLTTIFNKDQNGAYIHEEGLTLSESSARISGLHRIDAEYENAINDLKEMIQQVTHPPAKKFAGNNGTMQLPATIKIFLASSAELVEDRGLLEIFIARENNELVKKGRYIELIIWENFLDVLSKDGLQKEYNKAIRECDIFISLFFSKVGKYTEEEFEVAFGQFTEKNKPMIYTYFKDAPISAENISDDILSLLKFKKKLQDLGHYRTVYKTFSDLQNHLKSQLEKLHIS